jgi:hypothetical protein
MKRVRAVEDAPICVSVLPEQLKPSRQTLPLVPLHGSPATEGRRQWPATHIRSSPHWLSLLHTAPSASRGAQMLGHASVPAQNALPLHSALIEQAAPISTVPVSTSMQGAGKLCESTSHPSARMPFWHAGS